MHAHVVRDEIEDQSEVAGLERSAEFLKTFFAAEFGIESGVIDDVVAMRAAAARACEG
jgi:hypothetical protein